MRLIRAVRELNAEHNHGIRTIALHTDAERRAVEATLLAEKVGVPARAAVAVGVAAIAYPPCR